MKLEFLNRIIISLIIFQYPGTSGGDGPGTIQMLYYQVEYKADAESVLHRNLDRDQGLGLGQRKLDFRLPQEQSSALVVSLSHVGELWAF